MLCSLGVPLCRDKQTERLSNLSLLSSLFFVPSFMGYHPFFHYYRR